MIKWLLLIFILPSLLFGKFYSIENENDGSIGYVQTYFHAHHHDHENGTSAHAHSHIHFVKTSNILVDSLLFLVQNNFFTPSLTTNNIVDIDLFIPNNRTQDVFRPPIIT